MALRTFLLALAFTIQVYTSVIPQQPLRYDEATNPAGISDALSRLEDSVGNRLIHAVPVAAPCYGQGASASAQCTKVNEMKKDDRWISRQPAGYFYSNWASCQSNGEACAIPLNNSASLISPDAKCHQGSVPSLMINLTSMDTLVDDIQAAFRYADETRLPLVIKNTGHDWKGRGAAPRSLALWTHHLQHPQVPIVRNDNFVPTGCSNHPRETVLHFGPGQQWGGAYHFAEEHDLALLGGTCGTVGVAGWLHGGGHSPLTPVLGMGADNLRQIEIVTPGLGKIVANECQHSDVFFAVRGGGGGAFGVVTNITYKAVPKFGLQAINLQFANLETIQMRSYFALLASNAVNWSTKGWGGYIKSSPQTQNIEIVKPNSSPAAAQTDMDPLIEFLAQHGVKVEIKNYPSWFAYFREHLEPPDKHVAGYSANVASRLLPPSVFNDHKDQLVNALMDMYSDPHKLNFWLMLVTPMRFNHTRTSAVHPTWRDATLLVRMNDRWDQFYDHSDTNAARGHFRAVHGCFDGIRRLAPGMGVSVSESDVWEEDYTEAFWGEGVYGRLVGVKNKVDPRNLLSNYAAVGWVPGDERYRCYPKP